MPPLDIDLNLPAATDESCTSTVVILPSEQARMISQEPEQEPQPGLSSEPGRTCLAETSSGSKRRRGSIRINDDRDEHIAAQPAPQPRPAPTFICSICLEQIVEETTTKCGHIFCRKCISNSLACQRKCPTCRKKLRRNDILRIYFPKND